MSASDTDSTAVKPLTKRKRETSELYRRRPEVEGQIQQACRLRASQVFGTFQTRSRDEADYLFDETLVYLLREARGKDDREEIDVLYLELNRRVWRLLSRFKTSFNEYADFEDLGQKVEMTILTKLLDLGSDSADYAQVNFGDFVVTEAKAARRGKLAAITREMELNDQGRDDGAGNTVVDNLDSGEATAEQRLVLKEGMRKLPPHIRQAAALVADGWKIESNDQDEPTIAKQFGVTSRTIRNWMKEGKELLAGYEGELMR